MQHRGELLKNAIKESGVPVTKIHKALNKSRRWLYNQYENRDVMLDILVKVGKIIHHDFSTDVTELRSTKDPGQFQDSGEIPYPLENAAYWKDKYLRLLEEYTELLKKAR